MGQEIPNSRFSAADFERYQGMLAEESGLLKQWFDDEAFINGPLVAGCELEAWLVRDTGEPAPVNTECLESLSEEQASPELSQFNIELNFSPRTLSDHALSVIDRDIHEGLNRLQEVAGRHEASAVYCGILPTVTADHLTPENMSPLNRYAALNEQVLLHRNHEPLHIDVVGHEHLSLHHNDVMLESATTSFQVHLQVPQHQAARYFNASLILSAPLVAVSANSPYFLGYDLWEETRIPLFEQSVASGGYAQGAHGPLKRITFGCDYVRESLWECFDENLKRYPVLLPHDFATPSEQLAHLRLHNGTIWRWVRPLIGFTGDVPHLRLEQRVIPAGPTVVDMLANMAFYYGLTQYYAHMSQPPESRIEFALSRENFYKAAKHGLDTHIHWLDGESIQISRLITTILLEQAWLGLEQMGIASSDIQHYLGIIEQRVLTGNTGSQWQRQYVARNGKNMARLLEQYRKHQRTGQPVHTWD